MEGVEETVVVLVLGGAPKSGGYTSEQFRAQLLECNALRPLREAMATSSKPHELDTGALIFVDSQIYDSTIDALRACTLRTRRWMVIIESKYESIIRMELAELPFKRRPKIRKQRWVLSVTHGTLTETGATHFPQRVGSSSADGLSPTAEMVHG